MSGSPELKESRKGAQSVQANCGIKRRKKLTQERVRELFDYQEDGSLIWRVSTGKARVGNTVGSVGKRGYLETKLAGSHYYIHRLVWLWHKGYLPENQIDHRDKLNNRIGNLREVTQQCNNRNTGNCCLNTSGVKGVRWSKNVAKWEAYIKVTRRKKFLGYHLSLEEAVAIRLAMEQCLNWAGCDSRTPAYKFIQNLILNKE